MLKSVTLLTLLFSCALLQDTSICHWSRRLLTNESGTFIPLTIIHGDLSHGWIGDSKFTKACWARPTCQVDNHSFMCNQRTGLNHMEFAQMNLGHLKKVNYINIISESHRTRYSTTIHRVNWAENSKYNTHFVVDSKTELDICPNTTTVSIRWTIKGNLSDADEFICYDHGIFRCAGVYIGDPVQAGKCHMVVDGDKLIHETTVRKIGRDRLSFYTCSLETSEHHSMTFIVDWKDAEQPSQIPVTHSKTAARSPTTTSRTPLATTTAGPSDSSASHSIMPANILATGGALLVFALASAI